MAYKSFTIMTGKFTQDITLNVANIFILDTVLEMFNLRRPEDNLLWIIL